MGSKVTSGIVLYKSQTKKNGKHPAKLRITFNRKQMYYSIDNKDRVYEFTPEEFNKIFAPKPRGIHKDIQLEFSLIEDKAKKIIASMEDFSFRQFKAKFGVAGGDLTNLLFYFNRRVKEFESNEQYCSRAQFLTSLRNLQTYFGSNRIDFKELTVHELEKFENWLVARNVSLSSVASYMAAIRTIFKIGHREGVIPREIYPFGAEGYKLPVSQNTKKALKLEEIKKIYEYVPEPNSEREKCRDMWLFSYLMNGANMNDIVRLKYKNIDSDFITFVRRKTRRSSKGSKPITVPVTDDLKRIIERWGNKSKAPNNYIFNIINDEMPERAVRYALDRLISRVNYNMNVIAEELNIEKHITTYTARHSFSTVLKRSGVSTEFIGESLGHSNIHTTELYLDSFEDESKKEVAKFLTAFN